MRFPACSAVARFILVARIGAAEPIGAVTLGGMRNGLNLLNAPSFWQFVATGVVVILAVLADQVTRKRR